ncbi:hypothetical protein K491DRAFT_763891 [Lophiostoma macrostomum CBS 122681]|uniref:Uncharacterized protein n=1 Tax=Lophiostoma macrostomum CBS 122681 TaxID=1314788 RepID=A0A6A6SJ58_9PLEO|nr:hypothetical protein K491DRAFT_763891 [Lophiostoma macrostomum CBS 122681]
MKVCLLATGALSISRTSPQKNVSIPIRATVSIVAFHKENPLLSDLRKINSIDLPRTMAPILSEDSNSKIRDVIEIETRSLDICRDSSTDETHTQLNESVVECLDELGHFDHKNWIYDWFWELLAWALSTILLVATILLLVTFDGKLASQWNCQISINAMVAILSQAAVSALLLPVNASVGQQKWLWYQKEHDLVDLEAFDLASRGAEGSLRFLSGRRRLPSPATAGATITILMLGFQPFVQQAVKSSSVQWTRTGGDARIGRVTQFNDSFPTVPGEYGLSDGISFDLSSSMRGPLNIGLASNDNDPSQVLGSCSSSNCTWGIYKSLSLCASVEDVTSTIVQNCTTGDISYPVFVGDRLVFNQSCNVSTHALSGISKDDPNALAGKAYGIMTPWENFGLFELYWPLEDDPIDTAWRSRAVAMNAVLIFMQQSPSSRANETHGIPPSGRLALNLTVGFCSQDLITTMANGTTHTDVIRESSDLGWTIESGLVQGEPLALAANDNGARYSIDMDSVVRLDGILYWSGIRSTHGLVQPTREAGEALDATHASDPGNMTRVPTFDVFRVLADDVLGKNHDEFDPQAALSRAEYRMNNITTSMTNRYGSFYLLSAKVFADARTMVSLRRQVNLRGNNVAVGIAWDLANFIEVNFRWLAAPLILWLSATAFFFTTILATKSRKAPVWKSSVLALLQARGVACQEVDRKEIKRQARNTQARLSKEGRAWWLQVYLPDTRKND